MTDDLVKRLRELAKMWNVNHAPNYYDEAADEIEWLREELKHALKEASIVQTLCSKEAEELDQALYDNETARAEIERLRAALRLSVQAIEAQDALKDEIERLRARILLLEGYLNSALIVVEDYVACDTKAARAALAGDEKA